MKNTHANSKIPWVIFGLIAILSLSRLGILFQELPPFLFCDEAIFAGEAHAMLIEGRHLTSEFKAGAINIYPLYVLGVLIQNLLGITLNVTDFIIAGRVFYLMILAPASLYFIYRSAIILFESKGIALLAIFSVFVSPYFYSVSRIWYPDHYIVFFSSMALYLMSRYYKELNHWSFPILIGIAIAATTSVKYTGIFLSLFFAAFVILKQISVPGTHGSAVKSIVRDGLVAFGFLMITLAIINFSAFYNTDKFLADFKFNLSNYDRGGGINWSGIGFYFMTSHYLYMGLLGFTALLAGLFKLWRHDFKVFIILYAPTIFVIIYLGSAGLVLHRNMSLLVPVVAILFAYGVNAVACRLGKNIPLIKPLIIGLIFLTPTIHTAAAIKKDFLNKDSRILAREWIKMNLPVDAIVGHNQFCLGESPAQIENIQLIADPQMSMSLPYYVYNAYAPGRLERAYLHRWGYSQLDDQKDIHAYNINYTRFYKSYDPSRDLEAIIPEGYGVMKLFSSNGPDIVILERVKK